MVRQANEQVDLSCHKKMSYFGANFMYFITNSPAQVDLCVCSF